CFQAVVARWRAGRMVTATPVVPHKVKVAGEVPLPPPFPLAAGRERELLVEAGKSTVDKDDRWTFTLLLVMNVTAVDGDGRHTVSPVSIWLEPGQQSVRFLGPVAQFTGNGGGRLILFGTVPVGAVA